MMKFGLVMERQMVRCYCALSIATCVGVLLSSLENFLELVQRVAAHGLAPFVIEDSCSLRKNSCS